MRPGGEVPSRAARTARTARAPRASRAAAPGCRVAAAAAREPRRRRSARAAPARAAPTLRAPGPPGPAARIPALTCPDGTALPGACTEDTPALAEALRACLPRPHHPSIWSVMSRRPFTSESVIEDAIAEVFDLRPAAIIRDLDLLRPIYAQTAAYGHFGRELPDFTWERTDRVDALRAAAGLQD
ncbi:methionine adenosyltransferase domain-containing protein [Streptomyces sp. NPDC090036]|uniref:methionine adenosyltransferase domain-containing protein n=1 Tax=Streptomyces sp. NPDC090036 TaxID=3365926 RepID=UPI0038071A31